MRRTALLLAAALAAACGSPPAARPRSSAVPPPVPGIEAEVVLLRTDEAVGGQVQVRVTDTGDAPFTVTSVALRSAGFRPLPATAVTAEFVPGRVIDLPTPYGEPVCSEEPLPATKEISVVRQGGTGEEVAVPLTGEVLGRIHRAECAARAVLGIVRIQVTALREEAEALTGELVLSRREGAEPVAATRLGRSVLVDVRAGLPLELAGEGAVSAPVTFTPATCDPHVLSETKKPYVFPLTVVVGEDGEVSLRLPLDEHARSLLAALVQRVCAR